MSVTSGLPDLKVVAELLWRLRIVTRDWSEAHKGQRSRRRQTGIQLKVDWAVPSSGVIASPSGPRELIRAYGVRNRALLSDCGASGRRPK